MKRGPLTLALAVSASFFCAGTARAQVRNFPDDGRIVIGAERLTGLFIEKLNITSRETTPVGMGLTETEETETDFSTTSWALLGQSSGLGFGGASTAAGGPSMTPRLGVDVFIASGFSVGGSIMYTNASGTSESTTTTTVTGMPAMVDDDPEDDQPTSSLLILHPRVGYGYAFSPSWAIWPRLGFSYARYNVHTEFDVGMPPATQENDTTVTITDLTVEALFAATPVPNVAIIFGPLVDIGLGGGVDSEQEPPDPTPDDEETDVTYTTFGLAAGIALVF